MSWPFRRRKQRNAELNEELQTHLTLAEDEEMQSGQTKKEAHAAARRHLGNAAIVAEVTRDSWGSNWIGSLSRDLHFGARMLRKNPGFTAVAVLTLALGIGANTAMFSVMNTVLLQPLPFPDSGRLVSLWTVNKNGQRGSTAYPDFDEIRKQSRTLESVTAYTHHLVNLTGTSYPQRARELVVSPEFLSTLRVQPKLGRDFRPEEGQFGSDNRVAIITDAMWRSTFGADPQVLGRVLRLDGQTYAIIGVLSPDFWFLDSSDQLLVPLAVPPAMNNRANHYLSVIGRMRARIIPSVAAADLASIASNVNQTISPDAGIGFHLALLQEEETRNVRAAILVVMGAVGFVLLIACGNLASLLLARSVARQREFAVRRALGATAGTLLRQFLTESVLLSVIGGALGLYLAFSATGLIRALAQATLPRANQIHIDPSVLLFALIASVLTGITFALIPALHGSRIDVYETLKESARGGGGLGQYRLRAALAVSEVAFALILLAGAGLMVKSLHILRAVDEGFDDHNVLVFGVNLPAGRYLDADLTWYPAATRKADQFMESAVASLRQVYGVEAVGATTNLPLSGASWDKVVTFYDRPLPRSVQQLPQTEYRPVVGDYFGALGIRLINGRTFDSHDTFQSQPVVVVNQEFVHRYLHDGSAVGTELAVNPPRALLPATGVPADSPQEPEKFTIVGVVGDARYQSLEQSAGPMIYAPYSQNAEGHLTMFFALRATRDPLSVVPEVRQRLASLDKDLPLGLMSTMEQQVSGQVATPRVETFVLAAFGGLALLLASLGVYGIMSYSISQRTREIGIRVALGARRSDVMRMVMWQGMPLVGIGVAIGFAGAVMLSKLMKTLVYGVSATDPGVFAAACALLVFAAAIAVFFPARRAMRVDPMAALRHE